MTSEMFFQGRRYEIVKTQLYLPKADPGEWRYMYLWIAGRPDSGFAIWGAVMQRVERVGDLNGGCLHVHLGCQETYSDDTLGTDVVGIDDTTDLNYLSVEGTSYSIGEAQVDFEQVPGDESQLRCRFRLRATDVQYEAPSLNTRYDLEASGEFTVCVMEEEP